MRKKRKRSLRENPNCGRLARAQRAQQAVINTYAYSPHQEGAKAKLLRESELWEACGSTTCIASRNFKHNFSLIRSYYISTVTFSKCQISCTYSSMVRSEENLPQQATFKIADFAQPSRSRYFASTCFCASS